MSSNLRSIQTAITGVLKDVAELDAIKNSIISRLEKNVENDVAAAVARIGLCVYVFPPLPTQTNPNLPGPWIESLEIRIRVIENPTVNKTELNAHEVAELVLRSLCAWDPTMDWINPLYAQQRCIEDRSNESDLMFDVMFSTSCGFAAYTAPEPEPEPEPDPEPEP